MKMLGKLGWFGQCSCCNGPRQIKHLEKRQWRKKYADEIIDAGSESDQALWVPPGRKKLRAWNNVSGRKI